MRVTLYLKSGRFWGPQNFSSRATCGPRSAHPCSNAQNGAGCTSAFHARCLCQTSALKANYTLLWLCADTNSNSPTTEGDQLNKLISRKLKTWISRKSTTCARNGCKR